MGFGGNLIIESHSPRCCYSTEKNNINCHYHVIKVKKIFGYYYQYRFNPTCSRECYVKDYTIPCTDFQNNFLRTNILRCSSCSM